MSKRADKMYANSPKIVSDESGKKVIKKGPSDAEKAAAKAEADTKGMSPEKAALSLSHKHAQERLALQHKHDLEQLDTREKTKAGEPKDAPANPAPENTSTVKTGA